MSRYIANIGLSIEKALSQVPSAQPMQVAGYWANREFWLDEFRHLLDVIENYGERLKHMMSAAQAYAERHVGPHNLDEFGTPMQEVRDTSSDSNRRAVASGARSSLKYLADRALDLQIATDQEYDSFVAQLSINNRS